MFLDESEDIVTTFTVTVARQSRKKLRFSALVNQSVGPDLKRKESRRVHWSVLSVLQGKLALSFFNPLTPNDHYRDRTASLTSKRCILYIYSTNTGTEYFKHGVHSPFFSSKCSLFHNTNVCVSCIIHILYTGCAKIKKIIPAPKG
jgi:hypothetical protein